jgi:hypothetical protein
VEQVNITTRGGAHAALDRELSRQGIEDGDQIEVKVRAQRRPRLRHISEILREHGWLTEEQPDPEVDAA